MYLTNTQLLLKIEIKSSLVWDFQFTILDFLDQILWVLAIDGATNRASGAEHFLHGAFQFASHTAGTHGSGDFDDLIKGQVAIVLDVLDLLSVSWRLLQGFDDEGSSGGHDFDGSLTVLNDQLAGDLQALPVSGGLGDIITDLLGRQTKGTDLGSKGRSGTYLTTHSSQVHDFNFSWIELWRHFVVWMSL